MNSASSWNTSFGATKHVDHSSGQMLTPTFVSVFNGTRDSAPTADYVAHSGDFLHRRQLAQPVGRGSAAHNISIMLV